MSAKIAKKIRSEIGYHPSMPRKYGWLKCTDRWNNIKHILTLKAGDPRIAYQKAKARYWENR